MPNVISHLLTRSISGRNVALCWLKAAVRATAWLRPVTGWPEAVSNVRFRLIASAHRVAGGGHPPPAPTERSLRIARTTLLGEGFAAQRMPETAGMAGPGVVAVAASAP